VNATELFSSAAQPGVHTLDQVPDLTQMMAEAKRLGFELFVIDCGTAASKEAFLRVASAALRFPSYADMNWDAFEECVNDLEWAPASGYVILIEHCERIRNAAPEDWRVVVEILSDAAQSWAAEGIPFHVALVDAFTSE
jgi:hypothetical protein